MAVALGAVNKTYSLLGANAVVIGAGMIGLSAIQFLKVAGARRIIAIEPVARKLDFALQLGADLALNPAQESAAIQKEVMALCGSDGGVDVAYDFSGASGTCRMALSLLKVGGQYVIVAVPKLEGAHIVLVRELEIKGSLGYTKKFGWRIDFMSKGKVNIKPLISHLDIISLDDIVEKGFERLAKSSDLLRVIVAP